MDIRLPRVSPSCWWRTLQLPLPQSSHGSCMRFMYPRAIIIISCLHN